MGSSKSATVGYRYYMGLHFGVCHGPVDGLHQITVGERSAWSGSQTASGSIEINAPELFGGDSREGGVYGVLDVMMGESTQPANSYLAGLLGAGIPGFRGIMSAVFQGGLVASNNPYVKPWAFRVKRILQGWTGGTAWYPEKAEVNATATVCGDGYSEYFSAEYSFDPNLAATTPEASGSTVVISGMAATDILQITLSPIENNAWSRWLGYGGGAGYYSGSIDYPLWWSTISVKNAEGVITRLFDTSGMTAEAAYSANSATVGSLTGSTSYQLWIEDDVLYNRGSLSLVVKKLSANGFINADMNPAHIIYQCITDSAWGMGYPTSAIDNTSFTAAADALYAEGFGLSMLWNRQETIEAFIQVVLDHIGGMLYVKPDTGAFAIKLIRDDYDRGTLPQYGPTNLISAEDYQRQAWGETINEITVVYTAPCTGKEAAATVQDTANIMAQGGVVAQTRSYTGITNPTLAQRVAMRDLAAASTPLARIRLTATRAAWAVFPGDVFRLTWPEFGIEDVVYRALSVNRGTLQDGQIIIDAVEDVYALPENTYLVDQEGLWEDPNNDPVAATYRSLVEAPYWDLARSLSAADMAYVDSLSGYLETLAVRPTNDAINYTICTRVGAADYAERGSGDFCPSATIVETLTKTTTAITLANGIDLDLVVAGKYAVIENEYVLVSSIDYVAGTATISRGVLDTVPEVHSAGSRIWFADGYQGFETTEYADSETVDAKLLTVTGRGELNVLLAPSNSLTFDQRQYRPYPPGKVLVNTTAYPEWIDGLGGLALTWAHRDRLAQTAYLVEQGESSIGPEAGVTYDLNIYGEEDALLRTESGISEAFYNYTTSQELVDSGSDGDPLWSNVCALLHLNGSNNSTVITDETGRAWTAYGNARITTSDGVFGGACLILDGSGDYISTVHDAELTDSSYFKVEGRFKTNAASSTKMIVNKRYSATSEGFQLLTVSGKLYCDIFCAGSTILSLTGATTLVNSTWYYFELIKSNSTWYLRLNASTEASGTEPAAWVMGTSPLVIGKNSIQPGWDWNGMIDEFRITAGAYRDNELSVPGAEFVTTGTGRINGRLRFELESVRGGLVSYQKHNHTVLREGYGFNYGYYYGGQ